jgi:hypothetical protein
MRKNILPTLHYLKNSSSLRGNPLDCKDFVLKCSSNKIEEWGVFQVQDLK